MAVFGSILRELRKSKLLTQTQLADSLGLAFSTISMYERGEREPDFETMEAIADFFNVDMNYLHGQQVQKNLYSANIHAPASGVTDDPAPFTLTSHETELVTAYRSHPEMQPAIDKMLDIAAEPPAHDNK